MSPTIPVSNIQSIFKFTSCPVTRFVKSLQKDLSLSFSRKSFRELPRWLSYVSLAWTELLVPSGTGAAAQASGWQRRMGFPGLVSTCGDSPRGPGEWAASLIICFSPDNRRTKEKKLGSSSNKGGTLWAAFCWSFLLHIFSLLREKHHIPVRKPAFQLFCLLNEPIPFFLSWSSLIFCGNRMSYCLVLPRSCHPGSPFSSHSWIASIASCVLTSTLLGFRTCLLEILQEYVLICLIMSLFYLFTWLSLWIWV